MAPIQSFMNCSAVAVFNWCCVIWMSVQEVWMLDCENFFSNKLTLMHKQKCVNHIFDICIHTFWCEPSLLFCKCFYFFNLIHLVSRRHQKHHVMQRHIRNIDSNEHKNKNPGLNPVSEPSNSSKTKTLLSHWNNCKINWVKCYAVAVFSVQSFFW